MFETWLERVEFRVEAAELSDDGLSVRVVEGGEFLDVDEFLNASCRTTCSMRHVATRVLQIGRVDLETLIESKSVADRPQDRMALPFLEELRALQKNGGEK